MTTDIFGGDPVRDYPPVQRGNLADLAGQLAGKEPAQRLGQNTRAFTDALSAYPEGRTVMQATAAAGWPGTCHVETVKTNPVGFQVITVNTLDRPFTRAWDGAAWRPTRYTVQTALGNNPDGSVMVWDDTGKVVAPKTLATLDPVTKIQSRHDSKFLAGYDAVSQPDGALATSDSGHDYVRLGSWARAGGKFQTSTVAGNRYAKVDVGAVDGEFEASVELVAGSHAGILFRGNADTGSAGIHWLCAQLNRDTGVLQLRAHPSATTSTQALLKAEQVDGLDELSNTLRVRAVGKRVQVYLDGRKVLDHTLPDDVHATYQGTHWGAVQQIEVVTWFRSWWFRPRSAPAVDALAASSGSSAGLPALTRVVVDEWQTTPVDAATITPRGVDSAGRLYGTDGTTLYVSASGDPTAYTPLTAMGNVTGVELLDDGELLLIRTQELLRTTGFDGTSITGTTPVLATTTVPGFLSRTVAVWRNQVLVTEYNNDRGYLGNHRVWLSEDHGATFTVVLDGPTEFVDGNWHFHCCEIDPWRRIYMFVVAHFSGQDVYWATWADPLTWQPVGTAGLYQAEGIGPTTLTAVRRGIIVGTDVGSPRGVLLLDPDAGWTVTEDFEWEIEGWWANDVSMKRSGDGMVLLPWRVLGAVGTDQPGRILASADGHTWDLIWEDSQTYPSSSGALRAYGPTATGHLIGEVVRPTDGAIFWGRARIETADPVGAPALLTRHLAHVDGGAP